jgi:hypothetical protein
VSGVWQGSTAGLGLSLYWGPPDGRGQWRRRQERGRRKEDGDGCRRETHKGKGREGGVLLERVTSRARVESGMGSDEGTAWLSVYMYRARRQPGRQPAAGATLSGRFCQPLHLGQPPAARCRQRSPSRKTAIVSDEAGGRLESVLSRGRGPGCKGGRRGNAAAAPKQFQ